eukprot:Gregarina_sp_Poly_1__7838@NODE_4445_length_594_cov_6_876660_g2972_i0_p1_GENE_NODE_4445_length_594_cov_6_876660_g2972_i0NODE_4445_length_594_cov_6_876660_g2972_i0_p1_ORF_typecomplete_len113_score4_96ARS2/PF04959_13/0_11_NODE_4445_length_594_cov_6_876660_g2972_i066404
MILAVKLSSKNQSYTAIAGAAIACFNADCRLDGPENLAQTRDGHSDAFFWPGQDSSGNRGIKFACSNNTLLKVFNEPSFWVRHFGESHKAFCDRIYPQLAGKNLGHSEMEFT